MDGAWMLHPRRPWLKPLTGLRVGLAGKKQMNSWEDFNALLQLAGTLLQIARC